VNAGFSDLAIPRTVPHFWVLRENGCFFSQFLVIVLNNKKTEYLTVDTNPLSAFLKSRFSFAKIYF